MHRPKKLLDQVRDAIRLKHCSCCTDQAYFGWIERSIHFHNVRHVGKMGADECSLRQLLFSTWATGST
jgi:hypothetical protein